MDAHETLRELEQGVRGEFERKRRVLSFDEYFTLFSQRPTRHARSFAAYVRDCFAWFGERVEERPEGGVRRFALFDAPWDGGRERLVGQERAQRALLGAIQNFVRDGRVTRLVLLHGPNGSAKSTMIGNLARALEAYSATEEGAVYTFKWIFPKRTVSKKRLGFGAEGERVALKSYAHLEEEDVDAVLPADLRDHPLLLLPRAQRRALLGGLRADERLDAEVGSYLMEGALSPRSRAISEALLATYKGDFQRVLQHVQVTRFDYSRRYRRGLVTIEPQLHVDASIRQVTMDQGLQSLPPALRNLSLFEPQGDLVDGNRGLVEYNDLLKKPVDAFKYLLATCEKGTVALPNAILYLDALLIASSNDQHLEAFKAYPDFTSFKGRMDLIKVPYLRNYLVEKEIYDEQVRAQDIPNRVAPHSTAILALWAVLTRLKRPQPERFPASIRQVIAKLTPLDKADLYAGTREPHGLSPEQSRELHAALPALLSEGQQEADYEGSTGASPRVMKQVLLNALQDERSFGLSPLGIVEQLRALVQQRSVYAFLQRKPDGPYYAVEGFIDAVLERYLDLVDEDVQRAMGLVGAGRYEELFDRYIQHVSHWLKGEKIVNPATGRPEPADEGFMRSLEGLWGAGTKADAFRRDLIARVGAWRVDHPGAELHFRSLFASLFEALEKDYQERHRQRTRRHLEHMLAVLRAEDGEHAPVGVEADEVQRAEETLSRLEGERDYPRRAIQAPLALLLRERY